MGSSPNRAFKKTMGKINRRKFTAVKRRSSYY